MQSSMEGDTCSPRHLGGWPTYETWEAYPPVARWLQHASTTSPDAEKGSRGVLLGPKTYTANMVAMLEQLGPGPVGSLMVEGEKKARFVVCSDTHTHHEGLNLPAGDVLLHCGDVVGNYGKDHDLLGHLEDFCGWLRQQATRYALVVWIGGNHDTVLDHEAYPQHRKPAQQLLAALPRNVVYLEETGVDYKGIQIWGSPWCVSRKETLGQRFYSDAFERAHRFREAAWAKIPEGLDILMTHVPPQGQRSSRQVSDPLLAQRVAALRRPPRFHVFGHDHDFPGVSRHGETCFINASQEGLLRMDRHAGGCSWVFEVPLPRG